MTNGGTAFLEQLLPDYEILGEVGRGAMGVVHLGRHRRLDRPVAIKELQGALAADPATRERFGIEARALATLDHPHVVPVYDFVERDQHLVLIMEQLPGGTAWDRFVGTGLTFSEATTIALATCAALTHAHTEGILHRDVKPENLLFAADGTLKVTDFGIARMVNGASTKATIDGSVLGTPAYMAPEQAEGASVGPPADVYATATMLYEMLSGRLPFEPSESVVAMLATRIGSDPIDLRDVAPQVPAVISTVVMRGLARDQHQRIASPKQFGAEVGQAAAAAWGPGWLDASGMTVHGYDRVDRAARASDDGQQAADPTTATSRATIVTGSDEPTGPPRAGATVVPGQPDPSRDTADDTTADDTIADGPPADETPAGGPADEGADPATVRPQPSDRDLGRAVDVGGRELVDIAELTRVPRRPVATWLMALAVFAAGLTWAFIGGGRTLDGTADSDLLIDGQPTSIDQPIELDLSENFRVRGGPPGESLTITFEQMGIEIGTEETVFGPDGSAEIESGFIDNISTGAMAATLEVGSAAAADASAASTVTALRATQPWYLAAVPVVLVVIALFALATIESSLRSVRRGRAVPGVVIGAAAGGALLGASASLVSTVILGRAHGLVTVAGPAVVCAAGAVTLVVAAAASRRRRRISRRNTRAVALKKLQAG